MAVVREAMGESGGYVEARLRELGVEPARALRRVPRRAARGEQASVEEEAAGSMIQLGALSWRRRDLDLIEQLVAARRNVLLCGSGGTGKSAVAALLAGRIAAAHQGERVVCVLERYEQGALAGVEGVAPDPGAVRLFAAMRRGAFPPCGCLVFDEIYTSSGAHSLLEAWRRGVTGVGALVALAPEQGDCLGRLALLEESCPGGFTRAEVLRIYRAARPVILHMGRPGVIEMCGEPTLVPPWMEE
ncbi:MAG: hypothetical protein ACYCV6_03650 [Steroidobacteraceae bacterium]